MDLRAALGGQDTKPRRASGSRERALDHAFASARQAFCPTGWLKPSATRRANTPSVTRGTPAGTAQESLPGSWAIYDERGRRIGTVSRR
jgi:hypothetical protein